MRYWRATLCALLAPSLFATGVLAQPAAAASEAQSGAREDEAQGHFERGAALYARGELTAAIEAFSASYRLVPTANVAFNIAQSYEVVDRLEEAFNWYQVCSSHREDETHRRALERVEALSPKLAVLSVTVDPVHAAVAVDGVEHAADTRSPRLLAVAPGQHRVSARCAGCVPADASVEAQRGKVVSTTLRAEPLPGTLAVQTDPQGASLLLDPNQRFLGITPLSVQLPAGVARLTLRLDGYVDREATAQIQSDATTQLSLTLARGMPAQAGKGAAGVDPARAESGRAPSSATSGLGDWRWVGYGAAAGLLVAGSVVGVMALDKRDEVQADPTHAGESDLTRLNLAADLTIGAAIAVAVVTLVLDLSLQPSGRSE